MVQQAAERMELSESDRHLETVYSAVVAYGFPMLPSSSSAIYLILVEGCLSSEDSILTTC